MVPVVPVVVLVLGASPGEITVAVVVTDCVLRLETAVVEVAERVAPRVRCAVDGSPNN